MFSSFYSISKSVIRIVIFYCLFASLINNSAIIILMTLNYSFLDYKTYYLCSGVKVTNRDLKLSNFSDNNYYIF